MAKYTITKDNGLTTISNKEKAIILDIITKALSEHYGEENVQNARTLDKSPKNILAIRSSDVQDEDGFDHDLNFSIDITFKTFKERVLSKSNTVIEPFDFESGVQAYKAHITEQEKKKAERLATKNAKTTTKTEKAKELAEREKELDEVAKKVKEKREKEVAEQIAKAKEKTEETKSIGAAMLEKVTEQNNE